MLLSCGQDTIYIHNYGEERLNEERENYVLKNVTQVTYVVNEYEPANVGTRNSVEKMISFGLRNFIDENYFVFNGKVEAQANVYSVLNEASELVRNVLWIYDMPFADDFPDFSNEIQTRLEKIIQVKDYQILNNSLSQTPPANQKVGLYTFQRMVYDLKRACELEAGFYLDQVMPRERRTLTDEASSSFLPTKEYLLTPDRKNMESLKTTKPDEDLILRVLNEQDEVADNSKPKRPPRVSRRDLNRKIVDILEQNTEILNSFQSRFEDLQGQIDDIRTGANRDLRLEIAEVKEMIHELAAGGGLQPGSESSLLLQEEVVIIFEKNKYQLSMTQRAELNNALTVLFRNPSSKALVTGYADKTGTPEFNAWISKKRAEAVRQHLYLQGLPKNRVLLNYLGDSQSDSSNPQDRKVVVQFLIERN